MKDKGEQTFEYVAAYSLPAPIQTASTSTAKAEYPALIYLGIDLWLASDGFGRVYVLDLSACLQKKEGKLVASHELLDDKKGNALLPFKVSLARHSTISS